MSVDEDKFNGDMEMMHILHRLITAASDSKLRQDMNVEDEFFSAIENRDTAILQRDKKIAMQDETISKQGETISKQDETISKQDETIAAQKEQILSMVKGMFNSGMPKEQIADITKLSTDEIERLLNS